MTTQTDRYQQYALPEFPDFVVIDTTYRCNVICGMCHLASKAFHIPANPHISIDLVERMIPLLKKCRSVFLLGRGEPLMHPKIYDIIGLIKGECPDIYMSFASNGLLLTRRNIGKLLDLKLDRIHISVDGPDLERGHPQFEKAKANVRELALQKSTRGVEHPVIHISYVIGMDNVLAVKPTLEFGIEVGIEGMSIEPLRILEPNPEWDDYIKANSIYNHMDTVVPLIDQARVLAVKHGIQITTSIPTNLNVVRKRQKTANKTNGVDRGKREPPVRKEIKLPVGTLGGLKCDRPFKMLRVDMSGSVYMCPGEQHTNLNAFQVDPVEIWNSARFREVRCGLDTEEYDSTCLDCHILKNRLTFEAENERKRLNPDKFTLTGEGLADPLGAVLPVHDYMSGYVDDIKVENGRLTLMGWAVDFKTDRPCMFVVVFVGGVNCVVTRPTMRRSDVANHFSKPSIEVCGFMVSFDYPQGLLVRDPTLRVWAIDKFGSGREIASVPIAFDVSPAMQAAPPKLAKAG